MEYESLSIRELADLEEDEIGLSAVYAESSQENVEDMLVKSLGEWSNCKVVRKGCLAHLLQLTIKDAIGCNNTVLSLCKKVTKIVTRMNQSPKLTDKLRNATDGLILVKPCPTRWNSMYDALRRITLRTDKVCLKKPTITVATVFVGLIICD